MAITQHRPRKYLGFDDALVDAIDRGIGKLLGFQVLESLFVYLDTQHDLTRKEIPEQLDTFYEALESNFGVQPAKTIGRTIAQELYRKLGLQFEEYPNLTFLDSIETAKSKFDQECSPLVRPND